MRTHLFPAFLVLFAAAGCGLAFSLDGYEGPAKTTLEAGADGASSSTSSSGSTTSSSSSSSGSTSNSGSASSSGSAIGCPPGAIFCDDFERAETRGSWDALTATSGTLSIVPGTPTGNALSVVVAAGNVEANASLGKTFPINIASKVTMRSLVNVTAASGAGGVHFNKITFTQDGVANNSSVFAFFRDGGLLTISELTCTGTCVYAQSNPVNLPLNVWHDLALTVDFSTVPTSLRLTNNGTTLIETTSATVKPGGLTQYVGAVYADAPHGDYAFTIDSVVLTGQ